MPFRLPSTAGLIDALHREGSAALVPRLRDAYAFFYPDGSDPYFFPDPVDFFSTLSSYNGIATGWPDQGLKGGLALLRDLKRTMASLLIDRAKQVTPEALTQHSFLNRVLAPGNIIVTTNWDDLLERACESRGVPVRFEFREGRPDTRAVTILKLHGSVDWVLGSDRKRDYPDSDYARLREPQNTTGFKLTSASGAADGDVLVVRSTPANRWQRVSSRAVEPLMVTMVTGKQDDLGPLRNVWSEAYSALSRAQKLEIVGYSLPSDDVEVRTLLRAGVQRGATLGRVVVSNPAPDAHARFRTLLQRDIDSNFAGVS